MKKNINADFLDECRALWQADEAGQSLGNSLTRNSLASLALDATLPGRLPFTFSVDVWSDGVTDQGQSLTCWIFASMNPVRHGVQRALQMPRGNFQLSQSFVYFYDQLEKSSNFMNRVIETIAEPLASPGVQGLLKNPISDHGQWYRFAFLAEKYGVVPRSVMPHVYCSKDTKELTRLLQLKLRVSAKELREAHAAGADATALYELKNKQLAAVYAILCRFLGEPPAEFTFEYHDKEGAFRRLPRLTPREFFRRYGGTDVAKQMTIMHHPTPLRPFGQTYVFGQQPAAPAHKLLNLDMPDIKALVIAQLRAGEQVVMGCDVAKQSHKAAGYMHERLFDLEKALDTNLEMNKTERILYKATSGTHIMTISGVSLDEEGQPLRWKIQNSYGDSMGIEGHYVMDDSWFDEYVLSVVINKRYAPPEVIACYDTDPMIMSFSELY